MPLRAISLCMLLTVAFCSNAGARDRSMWELYKKSFLSDDGRIVDHGRGKTSHSEGQGYGMELAVLHNDRVVFERIWQWTRNNLQIRSDRLFAWQWGRRPNNEWQVLDYNNATDGDILIAYALLQADEAWHVPAYQEEALKIIGDIRTMLSVAWKDRTFLLPGYYGFDRDRTVLLNPSYLLFSAFRAFSRLDQAAFWDKVRQDGLFLIERSCFGRLCLPADWVVLTNEGPAPAPGKDPYFGAEAIRVLLALATEDAPRFPRGVTALLDHYKRTGMLPLWVDLEKDSASLKPAVAGYYAIYSRAAAKLGDRALSKKLLDEAGEKLTSEKDAYYSFSLYLLATADRQAGAD